MGSIVVNKVGKAYKKYPTRLARFAEWFLPGVRTRHELKWVLRDISFSVQPGEAIGIIGLNGAGKSTLLKIITGTTQATTGSVTMQGRVAAMLELGMGFHPDFTGRQNAIMAGQLLGLSVDEILELMPEIEAFAEIAEYIDQPVRVYSSGMQMRLAFSVATAVRPDILIVDEALSVGDAYFVHKSFGRIRAFREQGTTLLLVSHDKTAIQAICDRAVMLADGRVAMVGSPEVVMDYYNALLADAKGGSVKQLEQGAGRVQTVSGSGEACVNRVWLQSKNGDCLEVVRVGQCVQLRVEIESKAYIPVLVAGFVIKNRLGQEVFGCNTFYVESPLREMKPGEVATVCFEFFANMGEGGYSISVALHADATHVGRNFEWRDLAVVFDVVNTDRPAFVGAAWLPLEVKVFR